jgi:hypothetical protein
MFKQIIFMFKDWVYIILDYYINQLYSKCILLNYGVKTYLLNYLLWNFIIIYFLWYYYSFFGNIKL